MGVDTKRRGKRPDAATVPTRLRVNEVTLAGFKCFKEEFRLEITPPEAADDLDVLVLGSANGLGKTSVLEGIALAFLAGMMRAAHMLDGPDGGPGLFLHRWLREEDARSLHLERFINVEAEEAVADCVVEFPHDRDAQPSQGARPHHVLGARIDRKSGIEANGEDAAVLAILGREGGEAWYSIPDLTEAFSTIAGFSGEPITCPPLLYFHSYRRVSQRDPELIEVLGGTMEVRRPYRDEQETLSRFKLEVVRALAGEKEFFHGVTVKESREVLQALGGLVEAFVGGCIDERVEPVGNRLQILVNVSGRSEPVPFDALSSGQKEVISTLFLIWQYTRERPSIVLIDEPELHLNESWHDDFIRQLHKLAPENQYIIATHSERIGRSVPPGRVHIIEP